MSVSNPWTNATPASVSRKNKTSVITDSGTNLSLLNKSKFKIVTCNATGNEFILDHVYYFSDDGTTVIDLTDIDDHVHTASNGGSLVHIYQNNPEVLDLYLSRPTDLIEANWNKTTTGTGTVENGGGGAAKQYIRLRSNGTSGSGATISYTNANNVSFNESSIFTCVGEFVTASSLAFHCGVNCDDVTAADSNTRKYQAEVCTTTNNNWWLRTATGSANSASDIGVAINTSDAGVKMVHNPNLGTPEVQMEINGTNTFTKTTNIPVDSTNTTGNIIKFSIKNSTAADREYRMRGCRLSFITEDTWGYGP